MEPLIKPTESPPLPPLPPLPLRVSYLWSSGIANLGTIGETMHRNTWSFATFASRIHAREIIHWTGDPEAIAAINSELEKLKGESQ